MAMIPSKHAYYVMFLSFLCVELSYGTSADKCLVLGLVSASQTQISLCRGIMTWDAFVRAPVMNGSRLLQVTHHENGVAK